MIEINQTEVVDNPAGGNMAALDVGRDELFAAAFRVLRYHSESDDARSTRARRRGRMEGGRGLLREAAQRMQA